MGKSWINNGLSICEKKEKNGAYLRFTQDEAKFNDFIDRIKENGPGGYVNLTDKEADIDKQFDDGRIDEKRRDELKEQFGWIYFEGSLPPSA